MNVIACSIDIGSYLRDVSTASAIERITAKTGRWMLARLDHPKHPSEPERGQQTLQLAGVERASRHDETPYRL